MQQRGKAALVTGGAKRIGKAIVEALAQAGFDVAIHCNASRHEADAMAHSLIAQGRKAVVVCADLNDIDATKGLIGQAEMALGPLSLLVNNASLFEADQAEKIDQALWDRQFAVNLRAPCLLAEAFVARVDPHGDDDPSIINLIDQRVLRPNPQFFSYTLTKSTLWTATRTMAQSFAPRVRVNGVGPGPTLANQHDGEAGLVQERSALLLSHGPNPIDIAEAVVYLARARQVTGQMMEDNIWVGKHPMWFCNLSIAGQ